jgi:hypothetical protein
VSGTSCSATISIAASQLAPSAWSTTLFFVSVGWVFMSNSLANDLTRYTTTTQTSEAGTSARLQTGVNQKVIEGVAAETVHQPREVRAKRRIRNATPAPERGYTL